METQPVVQGSKTTPKDFFLWAGAMVALYLGVISFITLLFEYINYTYPDPLAGYADPYSGALRFAMASLIVLVPTTLILLRLIRGSIVKESGKATIWVRRWALVLTIFVATVTILVDLITLINTFLGGEITMRFGLKVIVVLLVAAFVFMHFLADLKGYWIANTKRANTVGIGVGLVTLIAIIAGFFIVGSPTDVRLMRYDDQKVGNLQNIQYQLVSYWQQKQKLPATLDELADPLSGNVIPVDPQTNAEYRYEVMSKTSFKLCATFNKEGVDLKGRGGYAGDVAVSYPVYPDGMSENWQHTAGDVCFERTIDPERYPPLSPAGIKGF